MQVSKWTIRQSLNMTLKLENSKRKCLLFFFGHTAQHVKLPQPGTEPCAPCTEHLRVWTTREVRKCLLLSVQFSHSVMSNSVTPWTAAHQASLSITNSQSLPKLMSIELMMPSNHLILCHPLLLPPSIFPSIRVFCQWVSSSHQMVKVLEFQLQHQSFQWTPRTDFL